MLNCMENVTDTSGLEWLLQNDPTMKCGEVRNPKALAKFIRAHEDRSCASTSLDLVGEDGKGLIEAVPDQERDEIEVWRTVQLGEEMEALLDLLRNEGVGGLARRMRCTPRSVQQKLKKLVDAGVEADLLRAEVAQ